MEVAIMTTARKTHGADRRVRDLAAIHVMTKKLGMDRGTYECLLMRVSGVRSSADLDATGRAKVIDELRRLGAPRGDKNKGRPANIAREPMVQKIGALLVELKAPWAYADAIAQRMFGIAFVAWVRQPAQLGAIIAALDARRLKKQELEATP
jgi:phage gp16-like protein